MPRADEFMLSYRHACHAGNHADVLKHVVLVELLRYLVAKDKPLWYVDTHAGAGMYRLDDETIAGNAEYRHGIGRLWTAGNLPEALERYVGQVRACNADGRLLRYPGSPRLAAAALRPGDRLWLSELHPADHAALLAEVGRDGRAQVRKEDGYGALRALLPPAPRRALVMLDPSYEVKSDYVQLADALADAQRRFATGVYASWFPLLRRRAAERFGERLRAVSGERWLQVSMSVRRGADERAGLYGSGMHVLNPPHTLPALLQASLPTLVELLAEDDSAGFTLDYELR